MSYVSHLLHAPNDTTDELINRWHHVVAAGGAKSTATATNIERELAARALMGDDAALEWIEGIVAITAAGEEVVDELTNF